MREVTIRANAGDGPAAVPRGVRDSIRLIRDVTHLVGRSRAFLEELAATERELALLGEPDAADVLAAMVAVREIERSGSLAAVERAGTELLWLLRAREGPAESA